MTNWWSVTVELEREIQRKFSDYTADIWKEDALTIDVVKASRKVLNGAKIQGETEKTKVVARVFMETIVKKRGKSIPRSAGRRGGAERIDTWPEEAG